MTKSDTIRSLIKIAKNDLRSSKLLHEKKLFPQSIFAFQQAVEKCNKALVIYADFFTLSDVHKVGHSQTQLVKAVLKKHSDEIAHVQPLADQAPNFIQLLKEYNFDFDKYAQLITRAGSDLAWINNETDLRKLSTARLDDLLYMMETYQTELQKFGKGQLFLAFQELSRQILEQILVTEVAAGQDGKTGNLKPEFDITALSKIVGVVVVNMLDFLTAVFSIHLMGFVFDRLVGKVRYPTLTDDFCDPTKVFNGKLPLVKKLPEFHYWLNKAFNTFEKKNYIVPTRTIFPL